MTARLSNPLAFVLGVSFALLPSYAPFVAIIVLVSGRFVPARRDAIWAAGALLAGGVLGYHEGLEGLLWGFAQFLGPWLIFRAFLHLSTELRLRSLRLPMGIGLIVGLAVVVAGGLSGIRAVNLDTAKTVAQAIEWGQPAALYGHMVLTIGALIAALASRANVRVFAMGLAAIGILVSGSREAAIAWVLVGAGMLLFARHGSRIGRVVEFGILMVMIGVAAGFGPSLGWGRVGFLVDLTPAATTGNMLQGTEIAAGDWWDPMGVVVSTERSMVDGRELTVYQVRKTAAEEWRRLQQVVRLEPGETYTVSAYLRPATADARPGIQGYGEASTGQIGFILTAALDGGEWRVRRNGDGEALSSSMMDAGDGWKRVSATFRYDGDTALTWWLGLAPDQRDGGRDAAAFAGFMLEPGTALGPYVAGSATHGLSLADARLPFWRAAWSGFVDRPLLGWGPASFADHYRSRTLGAERVQEVPTHAHNFFLQQLFERGLVGFSAALLLIVGLGASAVRRRDLPLMVALAGVLLANMFDNSLFYGGVLYPLAAVTGWRAGTPRPAREGWSDSPRQLIVRLSLVVVDLVMAYAALRLALSVAGWLTGSDAGSQTLSSAAIYALAIWPALAWREGLYPGYGLNAALELKRHVMVVTGAVLLLFAGTVVLPTELAFSPTELLLILALGAFMLPIGRVLAKQGLLRIGLWGRPVVVLGAGGVGGRVVKAMLRVPSHGLQPVAVFDDDPFLHGHRLHGVPIVGAIDQVEDYAQANHVLQLVVAIPSMPVDALRALIDRQGKTFERLQFVPNLPGLQSEDVYATSLDGMLALELHNGLVSVGNRVFKRVVDLLVSLVLCALLAPLLLVLYLWVRFDSAGGGFYRGRRIGEDGEHFPCLKFRTMHQDADARLQDLLRSDAKLRAQYQRFHKLEYDPRVTRAGRWIRKWSLDELPQIFNVVAGHMSLVGPRPYLVEELPQIGPFRDILFRAKPGMTGYWQVTGRNDVTFEDRLEMEAHYVRNWSFWWDIILLVQTPAAVLRRRGVR